jgi:hypothetical protein
MQTTLLAIDPDAGTAVRDASGAPVLIEPDTTDWAQRLARNSTYTIHPEEVLADNLALLVRRRLGATAAPTDADFFARFEAMLTDHV